MTAYYNEIDPYAAQWLRNLIAEGHIATGVVDERDIRDVTPDELAEFTQCHFFAGIGVWSLALRRAGWPDDRPVWTGSCPCQPFSKAGRGAGVADERHLWPAWFHLIVNRNPPDVFGEQVAAAIRHGWLDLVADDLEAEGYAVGTIRFGASAVGAPIERQRLYFAAQHIGSRVARPIKSRNPGQAGSRRWCGEEDLRAIASAPMQPGNRWPQPILRSVDDGLAGSVGKLRAYGNAVHAEAAKAVIETYLEATWIPIIEVSA